MTVYPNPARDVVTVEIPEGKKGQIVVFDMQGQLVLSGDSDGYSKKVHIDLSQLAVGSYSVEFIPDNNKERLIYTQQVIIIK
jgi:NMD protein affecting ribosome stability and mRNA decay